MDVDSRQKSFSGPSRARQGRRSDSGAPYTVLSRADLTSSWQHDLFAPGSSLYRPKLGGTLGEAQAQAPATFKTSGSMTSIAPSAPSHSINTARAQPARSKSTPTLTLAQRVESDATAKANGGIATGSTASLLQRLGFASGTAGDGRGGGGGGNKRNKRGGTIKGAATVAAQPEARSKAVPAAPKGTLVIVSNLVGGTTQDDVRAAFSDFGNILECRVKAMRDSHLFQAEVLFKLQSEAESARSTLDGVLADGEKLAVRIVPHAKAPPVYDVDASPSPTPFAAPASRSAAPAPRDLAARLGFGLVSGGGGVANGRDRAAAAPPTAPAAHRQQQQQAIAIPSGEPSKLRSDEVMQYDPRASIMTGGFDPEEPRQGGGRRGGGGRYSHQRRNGGGRRGGDAMVLD